MITMILAIAFLLLLAVVVGMLTAPNLTVSIRVGRLSFTYRTWTAGRK